MDITKIVSIFHGSLTEGIIWGIMGLGVYMSFRVLEYSDLTIDGSLALGAAVTATAITAGLQPIIGLFLSLFAGLLAGMVTAILHTKLKIPTLLAGILTQYALYSVNLRIMGKSNIPLLRKESLFSQLTNMIPAIDDDLSKVLVGLIVAVFIIAGLWWFLNTEMGMALRATGNNQRMIRALGVNTDHMIILCLMLSNGIVAISGSLVAMMNGYADVGQGLGTMVMGLAATIIGEVLFGKNTMLQHLISIVLGSIVYRLIIAIVLQLPFFDPNDMKLLTAGLVVIALSLPILRSNIRGGRAIKQEEIK